MSDVNEETLPKNEELYCAIKERNQEKIQYLLDNSSIDINEIVGENSYLHFAIHYQNIEIIKLLLDYGAIVKPEILPAFVDQHREVIKLLLSCDVDLNTRDFKGATYLHLAVKNKLIDVVDTLISKGADVNAKTFTNQTVLQVAFQEKNEEIIKSLLQCDIDVHARDGNKETPLHYAVNFENIEFTKLIIKQKPDVNAANKFGLTPLHLAVLKNNIELVKLLLKFDVNVNCKTLERRVPLHLAVANESIEIVKLLLENGAGINDRTDNGITPLHIAVDTGNKEMVILLISKKADVNATGIKDETPLNIAVAYEHEQIVQYLIDNGAIVNHGLKEDMVLHMAVFNKNENLVELLLKNGADVTVEYNDGRTALHLAVNNNSSNIAERLLREGTDINHQMETGDTVLHIATENGDDETCEVLLKNKPNINLKNNQGKTPLYIAAEKGFLSIVTKLLDHKPDTNENKSALHYAVKGKDVQHKKIVLELLAYGFPIYFIKTSKYIESFSFIEDSVKNGHYGIIEYLMKCGFDPNTPSPFTNGNENFRTLLHLAIDNNQSQIAKLLIDYGSDLNAIDEVGHTPIFYAIKRNNLEITRLLLIYEVAIDTDYQLFFMVISKGNHSIIQEFLNHYKNVNIEDEFGTTALHFAAWNGDEESIQLLFGKGVKCRTVESLPQICFNTEIESNIRDYYGEDVLEDFRKNVVTTPLHIAARKNHSDIVEALLEYGFDVDCRDGCGRTPLHIASLFHNTGVIDVLMEFSPDLYATDEYGYTCIDYVYNSEQFISYLFMDKVFVFIHNVDNIEDQTTINQISNKSTVAAELLVKYLARLNFMSGITNEKFIECYWKLQNFHKDCINEIEQLKNKKITNNTTFYDVLTNSISRLALHLKNESFLQIYESEIQRNKFHIYNNILSKRIRRAKERRILLNEAEIYFTNVFYLPDLLITKIMSYLHNRDLRCIKQAYESFFNHLGLLKCKES